MGLPSRLFDARPWESTLLDRACLAGFPKEHRGTADYCTAPPLPPPARRGPAGRAGGRGRAPRVSGERARAREGEQGGPGGAGPGPLLSPGPGTRLRARTPPAGTGGARPRPGGIRARAPGPPEGLGRGAALPANCSLNWVREEVR